MSFLKSELNKRHQEQQEAIWEFVTTEHRYLKVLGSVLFISFSIYFSLSRL